MLAEMQVGTRATLLGQPLAELSHLVWPSRWSGQAHTRHQWSLEVENQRLAHVGVPGIDRLGRSGTVAPPSRRLGEPWLHCVEPQTVVRWIQRQRSQQTEQSRYFGKDAADD
jgi:hypothetical protein